MSNVEMIAVLFILAVALFSAGWYCGGRWVWRGMRDKPVAFSERMVSRITSAREVDDTVKNAWMSMLARLKQSQAQQ